MKFRYNAINDFLKKRFGERVYKVTLESGCSCPNRDGTLGETGCTFCNEGSYNPATHADGPLATMPLSEQLIGGIEYVRQRHEANTFISYFQRGSNTYGPVDKLEHLYRQAIDHPDVVGLAISTRPDCLSPAILDVIEDLSQETMLWMELGLQSAHHKTLDLIGRGHTVDCFVRAHDECTRRGIPVCVHIIIGLPGETRNEIIKTARFLNEHRVWGVKIHNLHVLKDTPLETSYREGNFAPLSLDAYTSLVVDFLEYLSPEVLIHRLNSHSPRDITVAPQWSINKLAIFNAVEEELKRRDAYQGTRSHTSSGVI